MRAPRTNAPANAVARLIASFSKRGRGLVERVVPRALQSRTGQDGADAGETLIALARALLSTRGEASGGAIAHDILDLYGRCGKAQKADFFCELGRRLGPDREALEAAWARYEAEGDGQLPLLAQAVEAPRQELFRRLNLAPGGTAALVRMRADLLELARLGDPLLAIVDSDLKHVLQSWFNRGFLTMTPISWSSPARLLEGVIRFEAVHHITGWDDLRNRLDPPDRRCYAFVHPAMPDDLLIFVEVALTKGPAGSIQDILKDGRGSLPAEEADTANFYSISNCQEGLRGISFGHFLIKQVADDLKRELPNLSRFVTLSPIPGFRAWLEKSGDPQVAQLAGDWWRSEAANDRREWLMRRCAEYLTTAKDAGGRPLDPVARFHLGNGARLERINWLADVSPKGIGQSAGMMVNYLYALQSLEENHEAFAARGAFVVGPEVQKLLRPERKPHRSPVREQRPRIAS